VIKAIMTKLSQQRQKAIVALLTSRQRAMLAASLKGTRKNEKKTAQSRRKALSKPQQ
jgi:hypothetical protein